MNFWYIRFFGFIPIVRLNRFNLEKKIHWNQVNTYSSTFFQAHWKNLTIFIQIWAFFHFWAEIRYEIYYSDIFSYFYWKGAMKSCNFHINFIKIWTNCLQIISLFLYKVYFGSTRCFKIKSSIIIPPQSIEIRIATTF